MIFGSYRLVFLAVLGGELRETDSQHEQQEAISIFNQSYVFVPG